MRMSKGYSLVEMMVAAGVAAIFISMMIPFFMFQTSQQTASSRVKFSDQEVDLALTFMRRDILHAGLGCRGHEELALYVKDGSGTDPDELYVNYGDYLNFKGPSGLDRFTNCSTETGRMAKFLILNSVFNSMTSDLDYACGAWSGSPLEYQGVIDYSVNFKTWPGDRFCLYGIPSSVSKYAVGAVIGKQKGTDVVNTVMDVNLYDTGLPAQQPDQLPDSLQNLQFSVVPIYWSTGKSLAAKMFAPAISYRVMQEGLWRNSGPENDEWGRPLTGGLPNVEVTDLQIRCQFVVNGVVQWTPDDGTFGAPGYTMSNLRLLEITLTYRTKLRSDYGTTWTGDKRRTISVSPRTVTMFNR